MNAAVRHVQRSQGSIMVNEKQHEDLPGPCYGIMNQDSTEDDASQCFAKQPLLTLEPPSCMFIFCPGVHIICLGLSSGSHTIWYEVLAFAELQEQVHQMPQITKPAGISFSLARATMR